MHFTSTLAGDAPLLLGVSDRKVPTLPYCYAMGSDEQSSILLTLICLSSVLIALLVALLARSDTSIGCMKFFWQVFFHHRS